MGLSTESAMDYRKMVGYFDIDWMMALDLLQWRSSSALFGWLKH